MYWLIQELIKLTADSGARAHVLVVSHQYPLGGSTLSLQGATWYECKMESEHPWGLSDPSDGVGRPGQLLRSAGSSHTPFSPNFCNGHSLKGAGGEQEKSCEEHLNLEKRKDLEVPEME